MPDIILSLVHLWHLPPEEAIQFLAIPDFQLISSEAYFAFTDTTKSQFLVWPNTADPRHRLDKVLEVIARIGIESDWQIQGLDDSLPFLPFSACYRNASSGPLPESIISLQFNTAS